MTAGTITVDNEYKWDIRFGTSGMTIANSLRCVLLHASKTPFAYFARSRPHSACASNLFVVLGAVCLGGYF